MVKTNVTESPSEEVSHNYLSLHWCFVHAYNKSMKKYNIYKIIQFFVYAVFAAILIIAFISDSEFSKLAAEYGKVNFLLTGVFGLLIAAFLFLFIDLTFENIIEKRFKTLDIKAYKDPLTQMANRNTVDVILEKYWDMDIPEDMCCILFTLTSLARVNDRQSRKGGNQQIKAFSNMLNMASSEKCFVGRNGGNVFLALFENGKRQDLSDFLDRMEAQVERYNLQNPEGWIRYKFGLSYNRTEQVSDLGQLISIASKKAENAEIKPNVDGSFTPYEHYR